MFFCMSISKLQSAFLTLMFLTQYPSLLKVMSKKKEEMLLPYYKELDHL